MSRAAALAFLIVLAACAGPQGRNAPIQAEQGLVPDAGGLQPNGTPLRIDFGRAEAGVVTAVTRLTGSAPGPRRACAFPGTSAMDWLGLTLVFHEGAFMGWRTSGESAGRGC